MTELGGDKDAQSPMSRSSTVAKTQVSMAKAVDLKTDARINPMGLGSLKPRLSWRMRADWRGARQTGYEVVVARSLDHPADNTREIWTSGRIQSDESIGIVYEGPPLQSRQSYFWQVRLWDEQERVSAWSEPAFWEAGLLSPQDWTARWVSAPGDLSQAVLPMLRHDFALDGTPMRARVHVTCQGLYELCLNGVRIGDSVLVPDWTSYKHRLLFQTYDVTELLRSGPNAIGAMLGEGWYCGTLGWEGNLRQFADQLALLLQLEIDYADGRRQIISSGPDWKTASGPILASSLYDGETHDARRECPGWDEPGFDDTGWRNVEIVSPPSTALVAQVGPGLRWITAR